MLFTNTKDADHFAKDPAVVKYKNRYYLYHSIPGSGEAVGWSIGVAVSDDLESWEVISRVLPTQECEKNGIAAPGAIVLNGVVHLFYQTYGNGARDAICHAVSIDGVHFEKDATNPVFRPHDNWCCGRAIDADLCVFGDKLLMYFATRDHEMKIQKVGGAFAPLDSDFSRDAWNPLVDQSMVAPELKWEGQCIEAPATIVNNGLVYLFYGGSYNCTPQQVGCAVSKDGIHFERVFYEPFIPNGEPGSWNESESGHPFAFRDEDGQAYLFYQGSADNGKTWYISKKKIGFENDVPFLMD